MQLTRQCNAVPYCHYNNRYRAQVVKLPDCITVAASSNVLCTFVPEKQPLIRRPFHSLNNRTIYTSASIETATDTRFLRCLAREDAKLSNLSPSSKLVNSGKT